VTQFPPRGDRSLMCRKPRQISNNKTILIQKLHTIRKTVLLNHAHKDLKPYQTSYHGNNPYLSANQIADLSTIIAQTNL